MPYYPASEILLTSSGALASRGETPPTKSDSTVKNGLLLTPSIDHLFDRGFIGFEDNGRLIISPVAHRPSLQRMGIDATKAVNVGPSPAAKSTFWISTETLYCFSLSAVSSQEMD